MGLDQAKQTDELIRAAKCLREGGLVAFPTETVYGLGADATSEKAVAAIFEAKGRPSDNPLIIHIGSLDQLPLWVADLPVAGQKLVSRFWPGPLTLVLPHRGNIAPNVTAGLPTVAVRMPSHPVALALIQLAEVPVAAPSANRSGRPSPTEASHVWNDLAGRIDLLLDGGAAGVGVESTVVDVTGKTPVLLRPGGVSVEELEQVAETIVIGSSEQYEQGVPRSPGMKYRHYAPRGEVWLLQGKEENVHVCMQKMARDAQGEGHRVGILTTEEHKDKFDADVIVACGRRSDPASVARELYRALRVFDEKQADLILAETFPEQGIFYSVMNRLRKAADGRVIQV
ncbi:L-threonylcarbamoyladenylate synthase [Paenactinomyces guangxiensis]|uniref:Threonylcarbamoyl-AMP synthase n=1 Tax=Paenactinomyces guangxiensis TaxID=1490290 RepID=A0A7W1WTX7_9BACL|nr:L-threonylcarbamoyladenylate synthase [Paenactinomyces guangxiensis]MBA4495944.1 threonylcarbamoyl-AMP synthase [Paenactinomyces guangxiensis]MBH8593069.1 threonylcarbamoyl-AMP synthase [Paenactinomyces guangxiensis]